MKSQSYPLQDSSRLVKYGRRFLYDSAFRTRTIRWILWGDFIHYIRARVENSALRVVNGFGAPHEVHCSVCGWKGRRFESIATMTYYRANERCPVCGTLSRHRALATLLLERGFIQSGSRCLEVAPQKGISEFLRRGRLLHFSTDLGLLPAQTRMDVQTLAYADSVFQLIICFHVLEFVPNWHQALSEFLRVLQPSGVLILSENYLFGQHQTIELDPNRIFGGAPLRRFGDDFIEVIRQVGFNVEIYDYLGRNDETGDYFFLCVPKSAETRRSPIVADVMDTVAG